MPVLTGRKVVVQPRCNSGLVWPGLTRTSERGFLIRVSPGPSTGHQVRPPEGHPGRWWPGHKSAVQACPGRRPAGVGSYVRDEGALVAQEVVGGGAVRCGVGSRCRRSVRCLSASVSDSFGSIARRPKPLRWRIGPVDLRPPDGHPHRLSNCWRTRAHPSSIRSLEQIKSISGESTHIPSLPDHRAGY